MYRVGILRTTYYIHSSVEEGMGRSICVAPCQERKDLLYIRLGRFSSNYITLVHLLSSYETVSTEIVSTEGGDSASPK